LRSESIKRARSAFASRVGMFAICTLKVRVFAAGLLATPIVVMSADAESSPDPSV